MSLYLSYGQSLIDELDLQITDKYREAESHRKTEHYGIILSKQQKNGNIFQRLVSYKIGGKRCK
jgi:predicted metalloenzyme YecM